MQKFTYLLKDEQFQQDIDTLIDSAISMDIKSVSDLGVHLGNIHFMFCYALAGILTDYNNKDLRDKLIATNIDMSDGKEEYIFFDHLSDFLIYCLSKQYITKEEYKFLSQFRFAYICNGIYTLT